MLVQFKIIRFAFALFVAGVVAGCESPSWTHSLNESFGAKEKSGAGTEEQHRQEYADTHSRESLNWLLSHCVKPGHSYKQVCDILGEEGTHEPNDRLRKAHGETYRIDDEVYAFGPDSNGRTLYLAFREDRLVNFDPEEFK
jgi:hypothetical protein